MIWRVRRCPRCCIRPERRFRSAKTRSESGRGCSRSAKWLLLEEMDHWPIQFTRHSSRSKCYFCPLWCGLGAPGRGITTMRVGAVFGGGRSGRNEITPPHAVRTPRHFTPTPSPRRHTSAQRALQLSGSSSTSANFIFNMQLLQGRYIQLYKFMIWDAR